MGSCSLQPEEKIGVARRFKKEARGILILGVRAEWVNGTQEQAKAIRFEAAQVVKENA
jgi:hypothetical protein